MCSSVNSPVRSHPSEFFIEKMKILRNFDRRRINQWKESFKLITNFFIALTDVEVTEWSSHLWRNWKNFYGQIKKLASMHSDRQLIPVRSTQFLFSYGVDNDFFTFRKHLEPRTSAFFPLALQYRQSTRKLIDFVSLRCSKPSSEWREC